VKNDEAMFRGDVPWPVEDFLEVVEWYHSMRQTPQDDWDLKERGFLLHQGDGTAAKVTLNMFKPINQFGMFMTARYRKRRDKGKHFTFRFLQIQEFMSEHSEDLEKDGLIRPAEDGGQEIAKAVFEALCVLPYSKVTHDSHGLEDRHFDYAEVVAKVREIQGKTGESDECSRGK